MSFKFAHSVAHAAAGGIFALMLSSACLPATAEPSATEVIPAAPTDDMMIDTIVGIAANYEHCKLTFPAEAADFDSAWAVRLADMKKSTSPLMKPALAAEAAPDFGKRIAAKVEEFKKRVGAPGVPDMKETCAIYKDVDAYR
jgi:hypothetical protein